MAAPTPTPPLDGHTAVTGGRWGRTDRDSLVPAADPVCRPVPPRPSQTPAP